MGKSFGQICVQIARELMTALTIVALVFLSFGHRPVEVGESFGWADSKAVVFVSFCGGGPDDRGGAHGPCHACRASIADLPPPPCAAEPAFTRFTAASYVRTTRILSGLVPHALQSPRAPPIAV